MFKETATEKLIEYILALPSDERKVIAREIQSKKVSPTKNTRKRMKAFIEYTKAFTGRLPKNYRFNREEANER